MTELPVERELVELASFGLDYGIHLATNVKGETFQPALITRDPAGRNNINQLVAVGLKIDNVFDFAYERLQELPIPAAAAVVMDGNVTLDGETFDAVIVRVGKPTANQSHEFAQRGEAASGAGGWSGWGTLPTWARLPGYSPNGSDRHRLGATRTNDLVTDRTGMDNAQRSLRGHGLI